MGRHCHRFLPSWKSKLLDQELLESSFFKDTLVFDPIENEEEGFRQLTSIILVQDQTYRIIVRSPLVEAEDLLFGIGLSTLILCLTLIGGLYWLNRWQAGMLWRPFQQQLGQLRRFSLNATTLPDLAKSDISEFEELRLGLQQLMSKVQKDYHSLKGIYRKCQS